MKPKRNSSQIAIPAIPEDAGCVDRGWISVDDRRFLPLGIWRIPAYLRFMTGACFPSIEDLSFDEQMERTKFLVGEKFDEAIRRTGARPLDVLYGPGGVGSRMVPMGVLQVQAPEAMARNVAGIVEHTLELEVLCVYKYPPIPDGIFAIDIVQLNGRNLADPVFVESVIDSICEAGPNGSFGYLYIEVDGHPSLRLLNTGRIWKPEDFQDIHSVIRDLSVQQGIRTVLDRLLVVDPRGIERFRRY
jgi:hypothetical protein